MPDDSMIGLTSHELGYLLELAPGSAADRAKATMKLPSPADRASYLAAGAASLLVRKLASVDDAELITPSDLAALIGSVLTADAIWIELALLSDPATEAAFLVFGSTATLVIGPRALGTFEIRIGPRDRTPGQLAAGVIMSFLEVQLPGAAYARLVDGGTDVAVALRHLDGDVLEFSVNEGDDLFSGTWSGDREVVRQRIAETLDGGLADGA